MGNINVGSGHLTRFYLKTMDFADTEVLLLRLYFYGCCKADFSMENLQPNYNQKM
jgi:hypothetical protein